MTLLSHRKPMKLTGDAEAVGPLFRAYQLPVLGKNEGPHQLLSENPPYTLETPKPTPLYLDYTLAKTPVKIPRSTSERALSTITLTIINNKPRLFSRTFLSLINPENLPFYSLVQLHPLTLCLLFLHTAQRLH